MSKRQEIRDKQRQREKMQRIIAIVCLVIFVVAVVGIMISSTLPQAVGKILTPVPITRSQAKLNAMGDPNAPVKMIEYADFQCPFCKNFKDATEALIIETYVNTGRMYFEYYPVVVAGAESERAGESAYCASDQGKFWEMHDILYANQGAENSGAMKDARITAFAESIGLDMTKFNDCFTSGKYKDKIAQNGQDALKNIQAASNFADVVANDHYSTSGYSTPSFLINNQLVAGAKPFAAFQQIIEAALAAAGK